MTDRLPTGVIITDCYDDNARGRQQTRFMRLFGVVPTFLSVKAPSHYLEAGGIQATGHLIDQLDAAISLPQSHKGGKTVILMNVATRGEDVRKRWNNGTPFCYAWVGDVLICSTYDGPGLSLARDLGIIKEVQVMDIPTVMKAAIEWGELTEEEAYRIEHTQFRSYEFLPLAARWIYEGRDVPSETGTLEHLPSVKDHIWFIDNFGNAKTTILPEQIGFEEGKQFKLANGHVAVCTRRLADVPHGKVALTIGSSGFGNRRFVEVTIQRGNAAKTLGLSVGGLVVAESAVASA
ncbi:MAG TPA: SAM hydroxide adenosyltransferase [Candidatus Saccharimonadia bacterium]|jgi:hypothetical protein|nr:SAM hydroxide adenosyltransferase [Candidatus Saccharimonadia bacterium]